MFQLRLRSVIRNMTLGQHVLRPKFLLLSSNLGAFHSKFEKFHSIFVGIIVHLPYNLYRDTGKVCGWSNIAPLWEIESTELMGFHNEGRYQNELSPYFNDLWKMYGDARKTTYTIEDNSIKIIQNAALYVLAFNCGVIAYWFVQYKPILNDFRTNHGAKNVNGERNGQPRTQIFGKNVELNRFIILLTFLSKIIVPFVDSITGKSNRHT